MLFRSAMCVVIIPLVLEVLFKYNFEVVPLFSAIAVLLIILGVVEGNIFDILDIGRGWMVENIDALYVVADKSYGYLDSNKYAKQYFEELSGIHKGERLSKRLRRLFCTSEEEIVIEDRHYKRYVRDLNVKNKIRGHAMILIDLTENYHMMEQLKEAKRYAEEANESKSDRKSVV